MNYEKMLKLAHAVEYRPDFDMHTFCGLAHCIAGTQALLEGWIDVPYSTRYMEKLGIRKPVAVIAQDSRESLDLTLEQSYHLFFVGNWYDDWYDVYDYVSPVFRKLVAANYVRYCAKLWESET